MAYDNNGFADLTNGGITGFEVNVYSSLAAAATNLTGDIFHELISTTNAQIDPVHSDTSPYPSQLANSALVFLAPQIDLTPGNYFLSVVADASATGGKLLPYSGYDNPGTPSEVGYYGGELFREPRQWRRDGCHQPAIL